MEVIILQCCWIEERSYNLSGVIALGLGLVVIASGGLSSSKTIQIVCTIIGFSLSGIWNECGTTFSDFDCR